MAKKAKPAAVSDAYILGRIAMRFGLPDGSTPASIMGVIDSVIMQRDYCALLLDRALTDGVSRESDLYDLACKALATVMASPLGKRVQLDDA